MKNKFKTFLTIILILSCAIVSCLAFGCSCNENDGKPNFQEHPAEFSINYDSKTIQLKDSFNIVVNYIATFGEEVKFSSSNEAVASVDKDGNVVGNSVGTAQITVNYGSRSAVCNVTVEYSQTLPSLSFKYVQSSLTEIDVVEDAEFDLTTVLNYCGTNYDDHQVTYSVKNAEVGSVNGNVFKSSKLAVGVENAQTEVEVKATWCGIDSQTAPTLIKTLKINVVKVTENSDEYLLINNNNAYPQELTLYTIGNIGGVNYQNEYDFLVESVKNGVKDTNKANIQVTIDGTCISYENDKLKVNNVGNATVSVKLLNTENAVEKLTNVTFSVNVIMPIVDAGQTIDNVSAFDGLDIPTEDFNQGVSKIVQLFKGEENELTIVGDKAFGLKTENAKLTETEVVFYLQQYAYKYDVNACTKVIKTSAEFVELFKVQGENQKIYGSYLLDNDITITDKWEAISIYGYPFDESFGGYKNGFYGLFDGQGNKVTVNELGANGIFGRLCPGAIIANAEFEIKSINAVNTSAERPNNRSNLLAFSTGHTDEAITRVENVAIKFTPETTENASFDTMFYLIRNTTIKDCYIFLGDNVTLGNGQENYYYGIMQTGKTGNGQGGLDKYEFELGLSNITVVSKNVNVLAYSFYLKNGNKVEYKIYADNDQTIDKEQDGVETTEIIQIYTTVENMLTAEVNTIGSWTVGADGTLTYNVND